MDRVHIDLYNLAEELRKRKNMSRVDAYREISEAAKKHTKRLKKVEPKNYFKF